MNIYKGHRFPPDMISYDVWLYHWLSLSHRHIEDLLAERAIVVWHEAIRFWCIKFGPLYAGRLKRKHRGYGDTFYIDEVFVKNNGKQHYLLRAVNQDGEVVDLYLQAKRDGLAARFFKRFLGNHGGETRKIVTGKLGGHGVAHRELIPEAIHSSQRYENNRVEQSHEVTGARERGMRKFKSINQAQRFLSTMLRFQIYSTLVGAWSRLNSIEISESVRSANGVVQSHERKGPNSHGSGKLTWQKHPSRYMEPHLMQPGLPIRLS